MHITAMIMTFVSSSLLLAAPHLPIELSFEESRQLYLQHLTTENKSLTILEPYVQESIDGGEKVSRWLKKINSYRSADSQLRLSNGNAPRRGIPIHKPKEYGPSTIARDYQKIKKLMPVSMWAIIYGNKKISKQIPKGIDEKTYIKWVKHSVSLYQTSVRWTLMKKWLAHYSRNRFRDVRGYYYLNNLEDLDDTLVHYRTLSPDDKKLTKDALMGICLNQTKDLVSCETNFKRYESKNSLCEFKNKYWGSATDVWNSFFQISKPRSDIMWSSESPHSMEVIFIKPQDNTIAQWLKFHVEDEFQRPLMNWGLEMRFITKRENPYAAYLEFKPNTTPHVSKGNVIVMDANTSLEEYSVQWTIRHEYGHILGLPDCYHEFYDEDKNLMVNYQIDTTDLMCSRAGDMNDRIYHELRKNYFTEK